MPPLGLCNGTITTLLDCKRDFC